MSNRIHKQEIRVADGSSMQEFWMCIIPFVCVYPDPLSKRLIFLILIQRRFRHVVEERKCSTLKNMHMKSTTLSHSAWLPDKGVSCMALGIETRPWDMRRACHPSTKQNEVILSLILCINTTNFQQIFYALLLSFCLTYDNFLLSRLSQALLCTPDLLRKISELSLDSHERAGI